MRKYFVIQRAQAVVGCSCTCRQRYFPGDPALLILARSPGQRESWWVLVECQICGERRAFGETTGSYVTLRWRRESYPIWPVQFRLMSAVRQRTVHDDTPVRASSSAPGAIKSRGSISFPKD